MKNIATSLALILAMAATFIPARGPTAMIPVAGLFLAILVVAVRDITVLRGGLRVGFLLALLFSASIAGSAVALSSGVERGIHVAANLLIRFGVLWLVAGTLARAISAEHLTRWSRHFGMARAGLIVGLALNVLPVLIARSGDVFRFQRMRSRKKWWQGWGQTIEVLLAHTAHLADGAAAAATLRGHSCLVETKLLDATPTAPVVVVTGTPGMGKTPAVMRAIESLRKENLHIRGLIQPGIFSGAEKTGFRIRDLESGHETVFATRVPNVEGHYGTRFQFTEEGAELAQIALSKNMDDTILVVDELGPVELRGGGHLNSVKRCLAEPGLLCAVIVVRRHLVPALLETLSARDAIIFDIEHSPHHSDDLAELIRKTVAV